MACRLLALFATAIVAVACGEVVTGTNAAGAESRIARCSDGHQPIDHARPGAPATPLVPKGATSLLICDYNGMNATPSTPQLGLLGRYETGDAATIARFTNELDEIKPTPAGAVYNCPFDDDSAAVLHFSYDAASVAVTVGTRGCYEISSGPIRRLGLGTALVRQIQRLTHPVELKWATVSGHVRLCGGPITPSGKTRCWTSADGSVRYLEAIDSGDHVVTTTRLRKGRFHFRIARPGTYTFKLKGNGTVSNVVLARTKATVRAGRTTHIVLLIPVP